MSAWSPPPVVGDSTASKLGFPCPPMEDVTRSCTAIYSQPEPTIHCYLADETNDVTRGNSPAPCVVHTPALSIVTHTTRRYSIQFAHRG